MKESKVEGGKRGTETKLWYFNLEEGKETPFWHLRDVLRRRGGGDVIECLRGTFRTISASSIPSSRNKGGFAIRE